MGQSSSAVTSDPPHGMRTGCFVVSETVLRSLGEKSSQQELPELAGQNCLDCKAKKKKKEEHVFNKPYGFLTAEFLIVYYFFP